MEPSVERSRQLRQGILKILFVHADSGLEIGYTAAELANLMSDSIFGQNCKEAGSEIRDLIELGLIRKDDGCNPPRFVITVKGKDFCRAEFPWGKLDPFTGGQRA